MNSKRRDFLAACAVAAAAAALGPARTRAADRVPVLGLIFPPADRGVPEEGVAMYGEKLRFVVTGLGLDRMTPDGSSRKCPRVRPQASRRPKPARPCTVARV